MWLSSLVYAANKLYHHTLTQPHFGAFSPEQHPTATRGSCGGTCSPWAGKEPKTPSSCRQQGISGIQDLMVAQNDHLTVRNLFHLVKNLTESPGWCNLKSIPPSSWDYLSAQLP